MSSDTETFPRPPLDAAALNAALVRPGRMWRGVEVVPAVGSTNSELVARSATGAPHGTVLVTEHQTAGRGRLGRVFTTPDRAALTFSVLLRPRVPTNALGWIPVIMGVAAVGAVRSVTGVRAVLKWPNDVLVTAAERAGGAGSAGADGDGGDHGAAGTAENDGKLAGILSEADFSAPDALGVVVGIGLNVSQDRCELPVDTAVSLRSEGAADLDRGRLLTELLREFEELYTPWSAAGGDAGACGLAAAYRELCVTIGRRVRVHLPGDGLLEGVAAGVDGDARLLVDGPAGRTALSAGDVVHVRPGG
ncbi:BirA family biotin operon repressor/biotin-[acetyl-CoA-carboxylase] ligase [Nocardiopsis sp. Huas11]|uniref:biotin--[acetyl-CoA-carboxylase] ligase n=1 Tax=Nocardiopsis sp. Huas11 TaxID=2183912 RepID=UPI000EAF0DA6|nr:biotin--[acetyl-CoA-carboxylase] ligase [Nocardiopsis sp. Huas11]RKS05562.1 BirA family biotin operon repressor/biotin-[acetyl-CoA-carboxylase] ligase [Nocardiopsis sp. Huas11]